MKKTVAFSIQINGNSVFVSASEKEDFEERAAIMEYQGGLDQNRAEQEALALVLKRRNILKKSA